MEKVINHNSSVRLPLPIQGMVLAGYGEQPVGISTAREWEAEAYAKGRKEAEDFAQAQIVEMRIEFLKLQEQLFENIENQFQLLVETYCASVPNLVIALVRRLWGGLELTSAEVKKNLEELLSETGSNREELEVRLASEDLALIRDLDQGALGQLSKIELKEDAALERGDCLILSRFGMIDGRIETKLKKVEQELRA